MTRAWSRTGFEPFVAARRTALLPTAFLLTRQREEAHIAAASEAAENLPGFGGIEIRRDTQRIVVYYTAISPEQREKVIGDALRDIFSFVRVERTYAELSALRDRITRDTGMWHARGLVIAEWGPDVRSNTVKVNVLKLTPEQKRLLIDRYGASNITVGSVDQLETVGGGIEGGGQTPRRSVPRPPSR